MLANSSGLLRISLVLVFGMTVMAGAVFAQDSAPASGEYRIAVADIQTLLADYDKRQELYDELESEVESRQEEIDQLSNQIEAARQRYEQQAPNMTEAERIEQRNQIESDYLTYTSELRQNQNYIDSREESVLREVLGDIQAAIERIAIEDNYHIVLNAQPGPQGSVLYHSATIDITSQVLTVLNSSN